VITSLHLSGGDGQLERFDARLIVCFRQPASLFIRTTLFDNQTTHLFGRATDFSSSGTGNYQGFIIDETASHFRI